MFDLLIERLKGGSYLTLETTPPKEPNIQNIISKIQNLGLDKRVDGFSATDNPLAKLKYSGLFAALKLQQTFGKPAIATMAMRDKNKIALQSDLLGANDFDVRAVLALTGDPANMSDQPNAKGVFEGNSLMLLDIIKSFNQGFDFSGRPFKTKPKPILPFSVSSSYVKNFAHLQKKLHNKIQHGAVGIITQPVYDIENAKILIDLFYQTTKDFDDERRDAQLIFGLFPITRLRTAQFLSAHVPGIFVPQKWVDELTLAAKIGEEEEHKVGMRLSRGIYNELVKLHPKVHLMTANKFEIAAEIID